MLHKPSHHAKGAIAFGLSLILLLPACGRKNEGKATPPRLPTVEKAFQDAARDSGAPLRFLLAIAYLESRLSAAPATANYVAVDNDRDRVARGTIMTETAFGLPMATLGLDAAAADSSLLEVQVKAYGSWLKGQIQSLNLTSNPQTMEELYYWIENLATLHRRGLTQRRNVQVMFARELIEVLNQGFIWQDPARPNEILRLPPQMPPIDTNRFPENGRNWMTLTELEADVRIAAYLPLVTVPSGEFRNTPRRIEVIHCPLGLSGCMELQGRGDESEVHLAAHYLIPPFPDDRKTDVYSRVVQVADHRDALILTNDRGENYPVTDAIVIALVGHSGRSLNGTRTPADPTWFSDRQLRAFGQLVNDLCTLLAQKSPDQVNRDRCMSTDKEQGVQFRLQGNSEEFRWGDIPDYDPNIFNAYLLNPAGLGTELAFEFDRNRREFRAGEPISFSLLFNSTVRQIAVERLARCPNGSVVWETVRNMPVRGERRKSFQEAYFDAGPNRSGDQYFRARAYGQDARLIGWHVGHVLLNNFEPGDAFASEEYCLQRRD